MTAVSIEEWNIKSIINLDRDCDTLALSNMRGEDIDEVEVADSLHTIAGVERIKSLILQPSSRLTTLMFIKAMPALENLHLYGQQLRSLEGLQYFKNGKYIKIDTGKKADRDIRRIAEAPILKLSLRWGHPNDIEAIKHNSTIRNLTITDCLDLSLEPLGKVPIETISLFNCRFKEFGDCSYLSTLTNLILNKCRNLQTFVGDNGNIEWMIIEACNRIDFRTINTFSNIQSIYVVNIKNEITLGDFIELSRLRSISLQKCRVKVDVTDLKGLTNLQKTIITGIKKDQVIALSRASSDVLISNGTWSYKNGKPIQHLNN